MRGLWKPLVTYGLVVLAGMALLAWSEGEAAPAPMLAGGAGALFFAGVLVARGLDAPRRFLRGLADEGEVVTLVEDEVDWWGGRRVVAQGGPGAWSVKSRNGKRVELRVRGPHARRHVRVDRPWRAAGREAARAARAGLAWPPEDVGR